MLLSLIIPFFNAEKNSKRLFNTLESIQQDDIEFVLINDGSTDNTQCLLKDFKDGLPNSNIVLINQTNKGPGGARNSGLKVAKGNYVWFVDCDDDIRVEAMKFLREKLNSGYDFIDFNVQSEKGVVNSMGIDVGEYHDLEQIPTLLLSNFGCIWSKIIRREFLQDNKIYYPEYCLYEDNPLRFIYPFFVKSFLKTDVVGYVHQLDFESITRSKPNLRTLDRLYTASYGLQEAIKSAKTRKEIDILEEKFIEKFLIETVMKFLTKTPSKGWVVVWRVMSHYRNVAAVANIKLDPIEAIKATHYKASTKANFILHWKLSYSIITDQTSYFSTIRKKAWNL